MDFQAQLAGIPLPVNAPRGSASPSRVSKAALFVGDATCAASPMIAILPQAKRCGTYSATRVSMMFR